MSKYISGKEILEAFEIKSIELFTEITTNGLQPYDQSGTPIPPPDVSWRSKEIAKYETRIVDLNYDIELLDIELERFEGALLFYEEKNNPSQSYMLQIGKCQQKIYDYTIKKDAAKRKLLVLENKKGLHVEEWEFYRNRNPQKNFDSWQGFDLNTIPPKMVGVSDDIAGETLDLISSTETLYNRAAVESVFDNKPEVVAAPEKKPEAKSGPRRNRGNRLQVIDQAKKIKANNRDFTGPEVAKRAVGFLPAIANKYTNPERVFREWIKKDLDI